MRHAVGADSGAMFSVYSNGRMKDGNLEMHRWAVFLSFFLSSVGGGVGAYNGPLGGSVQRPRCQ